MKSKIIGILLALALALIIGPVVNTSDTAAQTGGWTAYNDCAGTTGGNTTTYTILNTEGLGNNTGLLKNYDTGEDTPVTVTFTSEGVLSVQIAGGYSDVGTDAYTTFFGKANMSGYIQASELSWWVEMEFTGLDPDRTYTFAVTANRAGTDSYNNRYSRFTLSGAESAVNASTPGVTFTDNYSVYFPAYNNSVGYVARWTGIDPGADGSFIVRVEPQSNYDHVYGPSVFMLQEEVDEDGTIAVQGKTCDVFGQVLSGVTVTLDGGASSVSRLDGSYELAVPSAGNHTLTADKDGYRCEIIEAVEITGVGNDTVDFKGQTGLIPNEVAFNDVLACINIWKYPPDGSAVLDLEKILDVIHAWKHPADDTSD